MSDDIEAKAREMGWADADHFRGDPDNFVSAEEYVRRSQSVLPFVKAQNRKLEEQLAAQRAETKKLAELFAASQESITALQSFHEKNIEEAVRRTKEELTAQLVVAREEGDVAAEVAIQDQLAELRAPKAAPAPTPAPAPQQQQLDPQFAAWLADNPWYGVDDRKTRMAMGIANQLRADPDHDGLTGRQFFDKVSEVMQERQGGAAVAKVGSGRPSGAGASGGGAGGRDYSSLPPDAKAACDRQSKALVGEGRAFKDMAAWQKYYAKEYYRGEE